MSIVDVDPRSEEFNITLRKADELTLYSLWADTLVRAEW